MCMFIHAKGKALICAYDTGILRLHGMFKTSLYIYLYTFHSHFHNSLLPFAWVSIDDKGWHLISLSLIK